MAEVFSYDVAAANNNSAPPDGAPENMNYSAVNDTLRELMAAVKRFQADTGGSLTTGGTANAITVSPNVTYGSYFAGMRVSFTAGLSNTGATTIDIGSIGAAELRNYADAALTGGEIVAGRIYDVVYNGSRFNLVEPENLIETGDDVSFGAVTATEIQITASDPKITLTDSDTGVDHLISGNSGVGNLDIHVDQNNEGSDPKLLISVGGGSDILAVLEDGSVGIGDSSPDATLDVNGDVLFGSASQGHLSNWSSSDTDIDGLLPGTTSGALIEGPESGHLTLGIRGNDSNDSFAILSGGGNYTSDSTYDTVVAYFNAIGRVGLGTTSPDSKLEVDNGAITVTRGTSTDTADTDADDIVIRADDTTNAGMSIITANVERGAIYFADPEDSDAGGFKYDHATDTLTTRSAGSDRTFLTSGGDFGIGNSTVDRRLHATDTGSVISRLTRTGSSAGVGIEFENSVGIIPLFVEPQSATSADFIPDTTDEVNIGTSSNPFHDLTLDGDAAVGGTASVTGNISSDGEITGRAGLNSSVSGTLVEDTHLDGHVNLLSGTVTLPTADAGCHAALMAQGSARTVNRGSGLTMYVDGSNVASATISARGTCAVIYAGASVCYLSGDVS